MGSFIVILHDYSEMLCFKNQNGASRNIIIPPFFKAVLSLIACNESFEVDEMCYRILEKEEDEFIQTLITFAKIYVTNEIEIQCKEVCKIELIDGKI